MPEQDIKQELIDSLKKRFDLKGFAADLVKGIGDKALRAAVAKTDTKLDDILVGAIAPTLEDEILKFLNEKLDSLFDGGGPL